MFREDAAPQLAESSSTSPTHHNSNAIREPSCSRVALLVLATSMKDLGCHVPFSFVVGSFSVEAMGSERRRLPSLLTILLG